jgi:hypothetical protein
MQRDDQASARGRAADDLEQAPTNPAVHAARVWWLTCTVCGPDVNNVVSGFRSESEMWEVMINNLGWSRRDDGRVLCRIHSAVADCDTLGHLPVRWEIHGVDAGLDWRYCRRCGGVFDQRVA